MCPHVFEHLLDVQLTKLVEDVAHEARLANCLLDLTEALCHHLFASHYAGYGAGDFAEDVVRCIDSLLSCSNGIGQALHSIQSGIDERNRHHPYDMLHTWRQGRDFGEYSLVRRPSHDTRLRSFRSTVCSHNHHRGAEILDKMPPGTGDGEDVMIRADIAHHLYRGMMLEQQVHV